MHYNNFHRCDLELNSVRELAAHGLNLACNAFSMQGTQHFCKYTSPLRYVESLNIACWNHPKNFGDSAAEKIPAIAKLHSRLLNSTA